MKHGTRYTHAAASPTSSTSSQEQLIEKYGVGVFRRGGLKIHTTIDPALQEAGARRRSTAQLPYPDDPSSAIVSIDPSNGYIRAMASSGTYKDRTFNLAAQGHRQPGSAFKTMVLTTAIRKGVDPNRTTYVSKPLQLDVGDGSPPWEVKTYDDSYRGTMNLTQRHARLRQHRLRAARSSTSAPKAVRETAELMGITTKLDAYPGRGPRRPAARRVAARDGERLRHARVRRHPQRAEGDHEGRVPGRQVRRPRRAQARARRSPTAWPTRSPRSSSRTCSAAPARPRRSAAPRPARRAPPTTSTTPGSWATRRTCPRRCGWAIPNALVEMRSVHGISVAGGTFPAPIWHDYMMVAHGDDCDDVPASPPSRPRSRPFFGKYATTGKTGTTYYDDDDDRGRRATRTRATTRRAARTTSGYDPRLYEAPPQGAPGHRAPDAGHARRGRRRQPAGRAAAARAGLDRRPGAAPDLGADACTAALSIATTMAT